MRARKTKIIEKIIFYFKLPKVDNNTHITHTININIVNI